jgi:hypothetical protein
MLSLFQNASGGWHWPSILAVAGWLIGSAVTGGFIFANLTFNRIERDKAGPWRVTESQVERFSNYLKDAPKGKIAIEYSASDQVRAQAFATTIKDLLTRAGYNVWGYMPAFQQTGNSPPLVGIQIGTKDQSTAIGEVIRQAFKAIGIDASSARITNNNYEDDYVVIFIGIKS